MPTNSFPNSSTVLPQARIGDETPPGSPQSAEGLCPRCGGSGIYDAAPCPDCDGGGLVTVIVGDA